jgi:hypothetical protein
MGLRGVVALLEPEAAAGPREREAGGEPGEAERQATREPTRPPGVREAELREASEIEPPPRGEEPDGPRPPYRGGERV